MLLMQVALTAVAVQLEVVLTTEKMICFPRAGDFFQFVALWEPVEAKTMEDFSRRYLLEYV